MRLSARSLRPPPGPLFLRVSGCPSSPPSSLLLRRPWRQGRFEPAWREEEQQPPPPLPPRMRWGTAGRSGAAGSSSGGKPAGSSEAEGKRAERLSLSPPRGGEVLGPPGSAFPPSIPPPRRAVRRGGRACRTLRRLVPVPRRQLWQRDVGCFGVGEGGEEAGGLPRCPVWARQGRWGGSVSEGDGRRLRRGLGPAGLQGGPLRRLPSGAAARADWRQEREGKRLGNLCRDSSNWWNAVERLLGFVRLMVVHLQGWLRLTVSSVLVQGCFSRSSSLERFFRSVAKMCAGGCVCAKMENHHLFWNMSLWCSLSEAETLLG